MGNDNGHDCFIERKAELLAKNGKKRVLVKMGKGSSKDVDVY